MTVNNARAIIYVLVKEATQLFKKSFLPKKDPATFKPNFEFGGI